ncbi:hypothetical protein J437_LFUL005238 [Ladona fulva]|uniref:Uncharacterized protein n=1 Tax=Ladona fulva TaxID=123851 RepID=A0A8K0KHS1_LADFU|nr:hypothetical protein J437_LFUL005238 [Ladona fulva]
MTTIEMQPVSRKGGLELVNKPICVIDYNKYMGAEGSTLASSDCSKGSKAILDGPSVGERVPGTVDVWGDKGVATGDESMKARLDKDV